MELYDKFIDDIYQSHYTDEELISVICGNAVIDYNINKKDVIDWSYYESRLTTEELTIFRAFSRISVYIPRQPIEDMARGFKWDVDGKLMQNEQDLLQYTKDLSGTAAAMAHFIAWNKDGDWSDNFKEISHQMVYDGFYFGEVS